MDDDGSETRRNFAKLTGMVTGSISGFLLGFGAGLGGTATHGHRSQYIPEGESESFDLPYDHDDLGLGNFEVTNENIRGQSGDYEVNLTLEEADYLLENGGWEIGVGDGYVSPGDYEVKLPGEEIVNVEVEDVDVNGVELALEYKSDKIR